MKNPDVLTHLESMFRSSEQRSVWVEENESQITEFLNQVFLENDTIDFSFTYLFEQYKLQGGSSLKELLLDIMYEGEALQEGDDWTFETTIVVGALEVADELGVT